MAMNLVEIPLGADTGDARRAQRVRERCGRFRILIIGRANAGKTTILQKVCNTTEEPEIYDSKERKVCNVSVQSNWTSTITIDSWLD
jgi:GTPase SAR1 family protein